MTTVSLWERCRIKIDFNAPGGCWRWIGYIGPYGYGLVWNLETRKPMPAHRAEYDHLCRNRWCVNPTHGQIVTPKENWQRGVSVTVENSKKTLCPNGHPYSARHRTGSNQHLSRRCLSCRRLYLMNWRKATGRHGERKEFAHAT